MGENEVPEQKKLEENASKMLKKESKQSREFGEFIDDPIVKIGVYISIFSLIVPLVFIILAFFTPLSMSSETLTKLGSVGDFLGGTTFLLAFASIIFIVASIVIQQKELRVNTNVLEQQKIEFAKSNTILESQVDDAKVQHESILRNNEKQIFETSFFNLLNLFKSIRSKKIEIAHHMPHKIDTFLGEIQSDILHFEHYIPNKILLEYYDSHYEGEDGAYEIYRTYELLTGDTKDNNELRGLAFGIRSNKDTDISFAQEFELNLAKLFKLSESKSYLDFPFTEFLVNNRDEIIRRSVKKAFHEHLFVRLEFADEYFKLIRIILKTIVEKSSEKAYYYEVFKSQITTTEEVFIVNAAYYQYFEDWDLYLSILEPDYEEKAFKLLLN